MIATTYSIVSFSGAYILEFLQRMDDAVQSGLVPGGQQLLVDGPAWPLGVSLAFIGVTKHIPKLDVVELQFRRWAHRAIGIPPFLMRRTGEVARTPLRSDPDAAMINVRGVANARVGRIAEAAQNVIVGGRISSGGWTVS